MHIPDGYLSPQTYGPAYAVMAAIWAIASSRLKKTLRARHVPLLALGACFTFAVMMFNVPMFGTTGHAVGAVLVAVLLGPWAAVVAVSLALIVQALIFGDGGVTAIGANCINMAVIMPFVGWGIYRLVAGSAPSNSRRHWIGAAVGGYVGLNLAAIGTALMFGIQPLIARTPDGRPLYAPFGIEIAVPVMAAEHLLFFGFVEAVVTGLVVAYLQRVEPSLIAAREGPVGHPGRRVFVRKMAVALAVLVLLSPLGLYLPAKFAAGTAWGEWSAEELRAIAGFVPQNLDRVSRLWSAPMPDYALPGQESGPLSSLALSYILSGALGLAVVAAVALAARKLLARKDPDENSAAVDAPADND